MRPSPYFLVVVLLEEFICIVNVVSDFKLQVGTRPAAPVSYSPQKRCAPAGHASRAGLKKFYF